MKIGDKVFYIQEDYDWWINNGWEVSKEDWHIEDINITNNKLEIVIKSNNCKKYTSINDIFLDLHTAETVCKVRNKLL